MGAVMERRYQTPNLPPPKSKLVYKIGACGQHIERLTDKVACCYFAISDATVIITPRESQPCFFCGIEQMESLRS